MDRRSLLSSVALLLAGCSSGDAADDATTTQSTPTPPDAAVTSMQSPGSQPSQEEIEAAKEYVPSEDEFEFSGRTTLPFTITYRGDQPISVHRLRVKVVDRNDNYGSGPWMGRGDVAHLLRAGMSMETADPVPPQSTITVGLQDPKTGEMTTPIVTYEVPEIRAPETEFSFAGSPGEPYTITHAGGERFNDMYAGVAYEPPEGMAERERWGHDGVADIVGEGATHETKQPVSAGTTIRVLAVSGPDQEETAIGVHDVPAE
jgi:hypothetical protein